MKKILTAACVALGAAGMFAAVPWAEADQPPSVTGGWTNDVGTNWVMQAKEKPNGDVTGHFKAWSGNARREGVITCLDVVDGNKAYVSGVITRFDPFPPLEGGTFVMRLTDGGEGAGSTDLQFGAFTFPPGAFPNIPCDDPGFQAFLESFPFPENTIVNGNIQVRD